MNKKGMELQFIVKLILSIAGFIAVAFFLLDLNLQGAADDEICSQSVIVRATSPDVFQRELPLNCRAKKYCLSLGGGECEQFLKEDGVISIKVPKGDKGSRLVESISANAMYDCWSMMGRGRLDIFSESDEDVATNIFSTVFSENEIHPKCVICSRIALAKDLIDEKDVLSNVDVNRYMKDNLVPASSLTYLRTFTDQQVDSYPAQFQKAFKDQTGKTTDEISFVFAQVLAGEGTDWGKAAKAGAATGVAVTGGLLLTPGGKVITAVTGGAGSALGAMVLTATATGIAYYNSETNHNLAATYCGDFDSVKDKHSGCSIIAPVDFNDDVTLNTLCNGGIEGTL